MCDSLMQRTMRNNTTMLVDQLFDASPLARSAANQCNHTIIKHSSCLIIIIIIIFINIIDFCWNDNWHKSFLARNISL